METINLNLIPTGARPVLHASQYDKGRQFRANLFEGSAVYTLTGAETLSIAVRKPDGHIVTEAITNTSDSYIIIEATEQMIACAGDSFAEVKIEEGGDLLGTLNLILAVEQSPEEGGDPSDSFVHNLAQQIADAVSDQYDSNNVIFDNTPTAGHGVGYAVTSAGLESYIPKNLDELDDVTTTAPTSGEALVWDGTKWVNGTVSTVGNLDDLSDVDTTGKATGDSLRYDGNDWIAQPTVYKMTQAEYDLINDFTPYENSTIVITDAPNLNPTASDIEYTSGVSVADMLAPVDVSSDISRNTTNVSQFTANCFTVGKVAVFDALDITTSISMGADEVMLTGLPAPVTNQTFELSGYSDMKSYRVRVNTSGELRAWHNSSVLPSGISLFGGFSYVIA